MKHTKQEVEAIIKKLLKDIKRAYHTKEDIWIGFENNLVIVGTRKVINNGWLIGVPVDDDQWNKEEGASIIIIIDDDTLEIVNYLDCSMGRPVPMKAIKKDRKSVV